MTNHTNQPTDRPTDQAPWFASRYVYVTHPAGTVHLTRASDYETMIEPRTLCGKVARAEWQGGDETVSGLSATCEKCKRSVR